MKLAKIISTLIALSSWSLMAQTISVMPQNVSSIGSVQVGNTVSNKCDGLNPKFMKLTVQPSCFGANLRSGGNTLKPDHGDLFLDLAITNEGQTYTSTVTFPNKVTWPDNYGQTCDRDASSNVVCLQEGASVGYTCTMMTQPWFLNSYLQCARIGDPLAMGELNKNVQCGLLYTWAGTGQAAVTSYKEITGVANCGLRERNENWGPSMDVASSSPATINKYAKRGKVVVSYDGLTMKKLSVVKNNTTGDFIRSGSRSQVTASFYQFDSGKTGNKVPLSQKVEANFDEFEQCLDIKATFLGTNQFCGSFYSPIMLFFDGKMPQFAGTSSFPLVEGVKFVYWPEKKAPGYFLAVDELNTGKVVSNKQLFGESAEYKNGFESLKRFDSNSDGVIDSKDKVFSKLVLWQDANGNGISEKKEIVSLESKGVVSISLKYDDNHKQSFGKRAEARQLAEFSFMKDGQDMKGQAIDIWFSPNAMANAPKK